MDLFVARQPIFDRRGELAAYDLLYRPSEGPEAEENVAGTESLDLIVQSILEIGLEQITRGRPGFLHFSGEMLTAGSYGLLDRRAVVIELLDDVPLDAELMAACRRLAGLGYTLALGRYRPGDEREPLLELAPVVKIDVHHRPLDEIRALAEPLRARGLRLAAERVESAGVRDACAALGFELFQGAHFSRPEIIARRGIPVELGSIIGLMSLLHDEDANDHEIEATFRRDPLLSYKLLRLVNAAAYGGRGIESITHAVRLIGRKALARWVALLMASSLAVRGGMDGELVHSAVVRARLCELLATVSGRRALAGSLFMTGLFSLMDALLGTPMEEIVNAVDLTPDVREALVHREGPIGEWLALVEAYEAGDWDRVSRLGSALGVSAGAIPEIYLEALNWAREQVAVAVG